MTRKEIKLNAKKALNGKWASGVGVNLVLETVALIVSSFPFGSLLLSSSIFAGQYSVNEEGTKKEKFHVRDLFTPINKNFGNKLVLSFMKYFLLCLWFLLFLIPGIIKCFSYAAADYISYRNPDIKWNDCITDSRMMMKGHKWEYFVFKLSFLGWLLLSGLTCGVLLIYVIPYHNMAETLYFQQLYENAHKPRIEERKVPGKKRGPKPKELKANQQ